MSCNMDLKMAVMMLLFCFLALLPVILAMSPDILARSFSLPANPSPTPSPRLRPSPTPPGKQTPTPTSTSSIEDRCWARFFECKNRSNYTSEIRDFTFGTGDSIEIFAQKGFYEQLCLDVQEMVPCLAEIINDDPQCAHVPKFSFYVETTTLGAEHLCSDQTKTLFPNLIQSECVLNATLTREANLEALACRDDSRLGAVAEFMQAYGGGHYQVAQRFCGTLAELRECFVNTSRDLCGEYVGTFTGGLADILWKVPFSFCSLGKYSATQGCGGTLQDEDGTFSSGYPNPYQHNSECVWNISVQPGSNVRLTFTNFDIENDTSCSYDYVEVRDGSDQHAPILGRFCGATNPAPVQSSSNVLYVEFSSDASIRGPGFQAEWTTVPVTPQTTPALTRKSPEPIEYCSDKMSQCRDHTRQVAHLFIGTSTDLTGFAEEGFYDQFCFDAQQLVPCMTDILTDPQCEHDRVLERIIQRTIIATEYVCSNQTRDLLPHLLQSECILNETKTGEAIQEAYACRDDRKTEVRKFGQAFRKGNVEVAQGYCGVLSELRECAITSIADLCGEHSGVLTAGVMDALYSRSFDFCGIGGY